MTNYEPLEPTGLIPLWLKQKYKKNKFDFVVLVVGVIIIAITGFLTLLGVE